MRKTAVLLAMAIVAGAASAQLKTQAQAPAPAPAPQLQVPAEPPIESARRVERDAAMKLVKEGKAVFVDVRPRDAYDSGHIAGSISIPLTEIIARMKELPAKKEIITY